MNHEHHQMSSDKKMDKSHYKKLVIMALLSFIAMYVLMYSMVDTFGNVYNNVNQFYMAGLMASPMVIIEVIVMSMMYKNRKLNAILIAACIILMAAFYTGIRQQAAVGDKQFIRSMIPHHGAAILMAGKTDVQDPELKKIIHDIITSQQKEIDQMKGILKRMKDNSQ